MNYSKWIALACGLGALGLPASAGASSAVWGAANESAPELDFSYQGIRFKVEAKAVQPMKDAGSTSIELKQLHGQNQQCFARERAKIESLLDDQSVANALRDRADQQLVEVNFDVYDDAGRSPSSTVISEPATPGGLGVAASHKVSLKILITARNGKCSPVPIDELRAQMLGAGSAGKSI